MEDFNSNSSSNSKTVGGKSDKSNLKDNKKRKKKKKRKDYENDLPRVEIDGDNIAGQIMYVVKRCKESKAKYGHDSIYGKLENAISSELLTCCADREVTNLESMITALEHK